MLCCSLFHIVDWAPTLLAVAGLDDGTCAWCITTVLTYYNKLCPQHKSRTCSLDASIFSMFTSLPFTLADEESDGLDQSEMVLKGKSSKRDEFIYHINIDHVKMFGNGAAIR